MRDQLPTILYFAGLAQLSVLVASAIVPIRLDWRNRLAVLPKLYRQMFWIYGGYVVGSIVALGLACVLLANELAAGGALATAFLAYGLLFWAVRLALQAILDAKPYLTAWWLWAGEIVLTALFVGIIAAYGIALYWNL